MPFHRREMILGGDARSWLALYRAGTTGDSVSQLTDSSGHGNHATQSVAANQAVLTASINGVSAWVNPSEKTKTCWWNLPSGLTVDRRSHGIYFIGRTRSLLSSSSRCAYSLGPGLTDLMSEFTGGLALMPLNLRTWGNGVAQNVALYGRSGLTVLILSAAGTVTLRVNGQQLTAPGYPAGTVTGGFLGKRQDGFDWAGEIYEFGIMPRPFTPTEMSALEIAAVARYGRPLSPSKELLFAGDSLTEGWSSTNELGWPWVIDNGIGDTWRQLNAGHNGFPAASMATQAAALAATYDATKTKHVAIFAGGIVDLTNGVSGATVLGYAQSWATTMHNAGWSVLLCTIAKRGGGAWTGAMETERLTYNSGVSGLTGVTAIVDNASLSTLSDPTNTTNFDTDQIHWLNPAHAQVAALVQPAILAV